MSATARLITSAIVEGLALADELDTLSRWDAVELIATRVAEHRRSLRPAPVRRQVPLRLPTGIGVGTTLLPGRRRAGRSARRSARRSAGGAVATDRGPAGTDWSHVSRDPAQAAGQTFLGSQV